MLLNLLVGITGLSSIFLGQPINTFRLILNSANILVVLSIALLLFKLMQVRKNLKKELDVYTD